MSIKPSLLVVAVVAHALAMPVEAIDLDRAPIHYSTSMAHNAVTRLQARLNDGKATLRFDERFGYLPALLDEFKILRSSQMLVFSKTSLQRSRIAPQTPRAVYFSDDVYLGYCQFGQVMEITAIDPQLGSVFYTLEQESSAKPRFVRQADSCLICHASSATGGFPGQLVRSVYADSDGFPILSSGSFRIDQTSPLKQRWGGWYVTGQSGKQTHLGNLIVTGRQEPEQIDNRAGINVTDLNKLLVTRNYPAPHSDIVALMVLEHQAEMHNRLSRAGFQTRQALYDEAELNKELERSGRSSSTIRRIKSACEPLVKYMLFSGETWLTDPIRGTSDFAAEFASIAIRDSRQRSLRDLDLKTRLFAYPCSYLIYSEAFDALPAEAREYVWQRLWEVLRGHDSSDEFAHLSAVDQQNILDILRESRRNLPGYWH